MNQLSTAVTIGPYDLRNRIIMAPMTRSRANDADGVQSELAVTYYRQRASAGLIIPKAPSRARWAKATWPRPASTATPKWRPGSA